MFQYNGKEKQNELGLAWLDLKARNYDPQLGRFHSVDPMADEAAQEDQTPYQYAYNNPVLYSDPDGLCPCLVAPFIPVVVEALAVAATVAAEAVVATGAAVGLTELVKHTDTSAPGMLYSSPAVSAAQSLRQPGESTKPLNSAGRSTDTNKKNQTSTERSKKQGSYSHPESQEPLPRKQNGEPAPDPDATGPHTQLGKKEGRNGDYNQAREFDENGKPKKDIDFTDHGRAKDHPNPHQHEYKPNPTGGTPQRSKKADPLN